MRQKAYFFQKSEVGVVFPQAGGSAVKRSHARPCEGAGTHRQRFLRNYRQSLYFVAITIAVTQNNALCLTQKLTLGFRCTKRSIPVTLRNDRRFQHPAAITITVTQPNTSYLAQILTRESHLQSPGRNVTGGKRYVSLLSGPAIHSIATLRSVSRRNSPRGNL